MTVRSVIIGVVLAVALASLGYLNDSVRGLTFIVGNHLPISVFGLLILFIFTVNPLLRRMGWHLRSAELAVIIGLMLVASNIPGSGLMRCFTPGITMPPQYNRLNDGWKKDNVMSYIPPVMLPGGGKYEEKVIAGFRNGLAQPGKHIGLDQVPWEFWKDPLMFWLPIIALTALAVICMSLIVHRQWSSNERLRYPIADFATTLMYQDPATGRAPILRNKYFWVGLAAVFLIRVVNGIHAWYPNSIEIPLNFDFTAITQKWPELGQLPPGGFLTAPTFYPTVIAFAFFLASDVSFSLGILNFVTVAVAGFLIIGMGVQIDTGYIQPNPETWNIFGAYLALGLVILWIGRHYYKSVVKQAVTFIPQQGVDPSAPWAFRVLIVVLTIIIYMLTQIGLDWTLAILTVGLILLTFLVMGRINAESGLFFIQARWQAMGVLIGLLGIHAFGPKGIAIVGFLCVVLTMDPRECLMPFMLNSLKMSQTVGIKPRNMGFAASTVFILGLLGAIVVVLWASYDHGGATWDGWAFGSAPTFAPTEVQHAVDNLTVKGQLVSSKSLTPLQRLTNISPDSKFLWAAGAGFILVIITSFLRLRLTWWPLHPVLFLCLWTYPASAFSPSLLVGWIIKSCVTKFGGGKKYYELKPLMIGTIAGDLVGGLLFMAVGFAYHALTGRQTPVSYEIFPG